MPSTDVLRTSLVPVTATPQMAEGCAGGRATLMSRLSEAQRGETNVVRRHASERIGETVSSQSLFYQTSYPHKVYHFSLIFAVRTGLSTFWRQGWSEARVLPPATVMAQLVLHPLMHVRKAFLHSQSYNMSRCEGI